MKTKYGIGYGRALKSRVTGPLAIVVAELQRMIDAGLESNTLVIVEIKKCPVCDGKGGGRNKVYEYACHNCHEFGVVVANAHSGQQPGQGNYDALERVAAAKAKAIFTQTGETK